MLIPLLLLQSLEIKQILQQKLATLEEQRKRLVDAFVYKRSIDEETYKSELDRLRGEITVTRIERNDSELDALDVETVHEFAEHVVLNARRMWSEFPLQHRRRKQKVLFPEGLAYDGEAFRTPVTCLFFRDLERSESEEYELVARAVPSWNQIGQWLSALATLQHGCKRQPDQIDRHAPRIR